MKLTSHSVKETAAFARKYAGDILKARSDAAFIIGLYGNLGSGKTAFTQAFAGALGVAEQITSPTFVIEKIYPLSHSLSTNQSQSFAQVYAQAEVIPANAQDSAQNSPLNLKPFTHLIHIDAYRLENSDEMKHLGWDEIAANPANIIVVEWPERIADLLPPKHSRIKFTFIDETTREIETE